MNLNEFKVYWNKFFSRKLIVFLVGSLLLLTGHISENIWILCAGLYIGGNVAQAFLTTRKPFQPPMLPPPGPAPTTQTLLKETSHDNG